MPLSEHEQRLLDEMERSLYRNDADFVATVGSQGSRPNYRMIVIGALLGVLGIAGIVAGVITHLVIIGVLGFLIMFGGVLLALRRSAAPEEQSQHSGKTFAKHASFMDRMNDRWDKRQDERGS
ncbi:MAG TPA: DUF3040 domain-containing protein [Terrimesophilobacter sp.]|nr:DUF3040 domain-containing protein [Terrimesophilobacter sp.]